MTGLADSHRKLVTVITEANLERDLVRELDALGVAGYTVSDARGRGDKVCAPRTGATAATSASRSSATHRSPSACSRGCARSTTRTTRS
jgi:hypothetical protein